MATLKNNGLRACLALMVLLFGVFMVVKAMDKEDKAPEKNLENKTWYFHGSDGDSRIDATKYQLSADPEAPCGDAPDEVCRISAPDDGTGKPNMNANAVGTQKVWQRINAAFSTTPTTNETVQSLRSVKE